MEVIFRVNARSIFSSYLFYSLSAKWYIFCLINIRGSVAAWQTVCGGIVCVRPAKHLAVAVRCDTVQSSSYTGFVRHLENLGLLEIPRFFS